MVAFSRKRLLLEVEGRLRNKSSSSKGSPSNLVESNKAFSSIFSEPLCVLVVNASHEMAKEITLQLQLQIPGCAIMYAPTIDLAALLIRRRKVDLIVSSAMLPDGSISKLRPALQQLSNPPDLVVIDEVNVENAEAVSGLDYYYSSMRTIAPRSKENSVIDESIKVLGADIRNDLNNPLQEIVAMVFVAKASGQAPATSDALDAIERAAKNLSKAVWQLEEKIRGIVYQKASNSG